jgi:hypothetical protein
MLWIARPATAALLGLSTSAPTELIRASVHAGALKAMLTHIIYYAVLKTMNYDVPEAPRWLRGAILPQWTHLLVTMDATAAVVFLAEELIVSLLRKACAL